MTHQHDDEYLLEEDTPVYHADILPPRPWWRRAAGPVAGLLVGLAVAAGAWLYQDGEIDALQDQLATCHVALFQADAAMSGYDSFWRALSGNEAHDRAAAVEQIDAAYPEYVRHTAPCRGEATP